MKKVFLAVLLVTGMVTFAQETPAKRADFEKLTTEQKVDLQVKRMTKELNLNEKQVADVKVLVSKEVKNLEAKREKIKARREMNEQQRKDFRAGMQAEQEANTAEMKRILTPEQFAKWETARNDRKEKMLKRMKENEIAPGNIKGN